MEIGDAGLVESLVPESAIGLPLRSKRKAGFAKVLRNPAFQFLAFSYLGMWRFVCGAFGNLMVGRPRYFAELRNSRPMLVDVNHLSWAFRGAKWWVFGGLATDCDFFRKTVSH